MTTPIKLFYSYSHKDESLRDDLETHLAPMKRQGLIEGWHDRRIDVGTEWAGAINDNLEKAQVILLLVSADFLASDYCYDKEMKRALERHEAGEALVIPIILRTCDWSNAPFAKLQGLPRDAKPVTTWTHRDEAWTDVVKGLRRAIDAFAARLGGSAPAPGPHPAPPPAKPGAVPAIPAPVATGTTPTSPSLRKLLGAVLLGDADLDAFCLDYFPQTYRRFTNGMDRVQKTNLVLQYEDAGAILAALREHDAAAVARHEGLA